MHSSLLVLICLLSWCGLGACRACHDKAKFTENAFICVFYCVFGIGEFAGSSVRKVSLFHSFAKSPLLVCYISKGSICRLISIKISFTSFGLHLQKLLHFRFAKESFYLSTFVIIISCWTMMFLCIILKGSSLRFQWAQDHRNQSPDEKDIEVFVSPGGWPAPRPAGSGGWPAPRPA